MKKYFLLFFGLTAFMLADCQPPVDYSAELPIIDHFDRADSPDVGGIWKESAEYVNTQSSIGSNRLKLTGYNGYLSGIYLENMKPFGNHEVNLIFRGEQTNFFFQMTVETWQGTGGYIVGFSETGFTVSTITNHTSVSSPSQAYIYQKDQNYRLTLSSTGNILGLLVVNSNTGASNAYAISNINAVGYDRVSVFGGIYKYGVSTVTTVDDLELVGR